MNAETIIRDEAAKFSRVIGSYERKYNGVQEFKSDLTTALYDYYDNLDKLIFLYEVSKQVDKFLPKSLRCRFCRNQGTVGGPFTGPPRNLPGNISNGALGFYLASAVSETEMVIELFINISNLIFFVRTELI